MKPLHIGLDLDNTLIRYDDVFVGVAEEIGLLSGGHGLSTKEQVKSFLRGGAGGDRSWMRLQGLVYGRYIERAELFDGVSGFLRLARDAGARLSIVSHKTRYGHFDPDRIDLWEAAREWLARRGFFAADGFALDPDRIHFEETRDAKIRRIAAIGCDVFVDDLAEVLQHEGFPSGVHAIWFAADRPAESESDLISCRSWREITYNIARFFPADS